MNDTELDTMQEQQMREWLESRKVPLEGELGLDELRMLVRMTRHIPVGGLSTLSFDVLLMC